MVHLSIEGNVKQREPGAKRGNTASRPGGDPCSAQFLWFPQEKYSVGQRRAGGRGWTEAETKAGPWKTMVPQGRQGREKRAQLSRRTEGRVVTELQGLKPLDTDPTKSLKIELEP